MEDRDLKDQAAKIEAVLGEIESLSDPAVRARVTDMVSSLLSLYGEGLARILEVIGREAEPSAGSRILGAIAGDELVSHLLLLHDLHPVDLETRVARALEEMAPYFRTHGGGAEVIAVEGGVARIRLQGSSGGCSSTTAKLKLAVEEAVLKAAPDLEGIEAEVGPSPVPSAFVPVSALLG